MLAENDLQRIMPRLPADKRRLYLPFLNRVMEIEEIDTPLRMAAFLAQLAHESGEFRFMEEIWGPTPAQKRYEPPSSLAARLGNTQPGDGKRFKGRGPIQITGRFNYKKYGDLLGVDLTGNPDLAATPQIAFQTAGLFWRSNGLNELADVQDFITITRRINGGTNGLADRQKYYALAKTVLGAGGPVIASRSAAASTSRGASSSRSASAAPAKATERLSRGYEAIREDEEGQGAVSRPSGESKKKSAGASATPGKKSVSKKSVKPKAPAKAAAKPAKKAVAKPAKKAAKKTAKPVAKKIAKPAAKKATKKPAKKAGKKSR